MPGLIGYEDGVPVAWVSLGPREDYAKLRRSPVMTGSARKRMTVVASNSEQFVLHAARQARTVDGNSQRPAVWPHLSIPGLRARLRKPPGGEGADSRRDDQGSSRKPVGFRDENEVVAVLFKTGHSLAKVHLPVEPFGLVGESAHQILGVLVPLPVGGAKKMVDGLPVAFGHHLHDRHPRLRPRVPELAEEIRGGGREVPSQLAEAGVQPPYDGGAGTDRANNDRTGTVYASLPPEDRPETGPRKELPLHLRRTQVDYRTREPIGTLVSSR